jgi:muconolactone delta-isomerase
VKILAIEQEFPGVTAADFTPALKKAEAARAWELYQAGVVRELYFRQDYPGAVLILECANVAEAKELLNTLPLVKEGLITFDIIPLVPYPGFARLFAAETQ